jgi:chromosome segregation ATPase
MHQVGERGPVPNDFDTVREGLQDALRPEHYEAALDRMEAEVEDLKAQLWNRTHERDGLRAACDLATAEVERLRALWQTANEGLLESETENTELGHEVERLRGENTDLATLTHWRKRAEKAEAEVERLRAALKEIVDDDGFPDQFIYRAEAIARAALAEEKEMK